MATAKSKFSRQEYKTLAEISNKLERYEEMAAHIKAIAEKFKEPFDEDERSLFSIAYKYQIGAKRSELDALERFLEDRKGEERVENMCKITRPKIQKEAAGICEEVLGFIDEKLIPKTKKTEDQVFYTKMKADYYKYMSEVVTDQKKRDQLRSNAGKTYADAQKMAKSALSAFNPISLGITHNYATFKCDTLNNKKAAIKFLRDALEDIALSGDDPSDDNYRDAHAVIELMREKIEDWQADIDDQERLSD